MFHITRVEPNFLVRRWRDWCWRDCLAQRGLFETTSTKKIASFSNQWGPSFVATIFVATKEDNTTWDSTRVCDGKKYVNLKGKHDPSLTINKRFLCLNKTLSQTLKLQHVGFCVSFPDGQTQMLWLFWVVKYWVGRSGWPPNHNVSNRRWQSTTLRKMWPLEWKNIDIWNIRRRKVSINQTTADREGERLDPAIMGFNSHA